MQTLTAQLMDGEYNIDPAHCDRGKGAYCPLWHLPEVIDKYGNLSDSARDRIAGRYA